MRHIFMKDIHMTPVLIWWQIHVVNGRRHRIQFNLDLGIKKQCASILLIFDYVS